MVRPTALYYQKVCMVHTAGLTVMCSLLVNVAHAGLHTKAMLKTGARYALQIDTLSTIQWHYLVHCYTYSRPVLTELTEQY
jgi:hypothetical protein